LVESDHSRGKFAMPLESIASPVLPEPGAGTSEVLDHFSRRLIGLARVHLGARLQHKIDPEDVVQSAYKSLLVRYGHEPLAAEGAALWGLLTLITIRKCADRARYYQAECRNLLREAGAPGNSGSNPDWHMAVGREPTPDEAAVLAETVTGLLGQLNGDEQRIVELSLQGYSTQEISEQTCRAERSVRRLRERVRKYLEQHSAETTL
jgi:RNA polymerase sigma-70 factor (ECF subfamily)